MKVAGLDNLARESVADVLVRDEMNPQAAQAMADEMNAEAGLNPPRWYVAVEDDYRLSRGMEDLV